jgi:hypothetical protein
LFAFEIIALAAGSTFRGISLEKIRGLIRRLLSPAGVLRLERSA